jgi:hypothetical protein
MLLNASLRECLAATAPLSVDRHLAEVVPQLVQVPPPEVEAQRAVPGRLGPFKSIVVSHCLRKWDLS